MTDDLAATLRARATEEWLRDLLHPRAWAIVSWAELQMLTRWAAADAAKGLRLTAEVGDRTNPTPAGLIWEPEW